MADKVEIERKFWRALAADRTLMLGLRGQSPAQPMTAQFDEDTKDSTMWFFTSKDAELTQSLDTNSKAIAYFASKSHDLFAAIEGTLERDGDKAMIDRLWNSYVDAWFEGGKSDPKLVLLRFAPSHAQVWLNDRSFFAGVKLLIGRDPKEEYKDKVADLRL